ncbi:hypothetical protein ASC95_28970 [Pelomonas sp. Root1217]|nr:hypothetical protein ASC95_28970 [Pelomonas sp. Root1217]
MPDAHHLGRAGSADLAHDITATPGGREATLTSFAAQPPDLRRLTFDHESFAVFGPLALVGTAFYPVLVHRLAASLHASSPHSVALMQLRFASFVVTNLRRDLHPQECAHAGRTKSKTPLSRGWRGFEG